MASATTAYARIFMSQFKNNPEIELYYGDTDSAFIKGELPDHMIGNNLGLFKLENCYKEIVFLGPKIYSGLTVDDKLITKIKGFKNAKELSFDEMKSLLNVKFVIRILMTIKFSCDFEKNEKNILFFENR